MWMRTHTYSRSHREELAFYTGHLAGDPSPLGHFRTLVDHWAWAMPHSPQSALAPGMSSLELQTANPLVLCPGLTVFLG